MAVKAGDLESDLIDTVCEQIREELPDREVAAAEAFVRQYYHWVPAEDLEGRDTSDLYGAAISHWKLARDRSPGEASVRVYNPTRERDGWTSPHTVLEIVSDDMPFIVDSVTMELAREGFTIDLVIHPVIRLRRDDEGHLVDVLPAGESPDDAIKESVFHAEVLREPDAERLEELGKQIYRVLDEVRAAVEDWQPMRQRALELADELSGTAAKVPAEQVDEVKAFLEWVADDHFTFLGYRDYELVEKGEEAQL